MDDQNFKWFVNTNITFQTSSSASGAMSEASFQSGVAASTLNGGTTVEQLNDSYDGYQSLCISTTGASGTCETGNAAWNIYSGNGPLSGTECNGRQLDFPVQTVGSIDVSRKVYVPSMIISPVGSTCSRTPARQPRPSPQPSPIISALITTPSSPAPPQVTPGFRLRIIGPPPSKTSRVRLPPTPDSGTSYRALAQPYR